MSTTIQKDTTSLQLEDLLLRPHVCNAPFTSLNFSQNGNINVCCMNRSFSLGWYPETSIIQAWNGPKIQELRQAIDKLDFSKGCQRCYKQIKSGNYENSNLKSFENFEPYSKQALFPTVLEFEMSSTCNYECIMCGGRWSSSIRKNREGLSPLISPYNSNFVKQLETFIPFVRVAHFLGGEPFATPIYYEIWERFAKLNPKALITATTNGSIYNNKVKNVLTNTNIFICLSLDSLDPKNYAFIRKNGNLQTVLQNFKKFQTEVGKRVNSIAFCPMIQNWHEIPAIIEFCRQNKLSLNFNTVEDHLGGKIVNIHENALPTDAYGLNKTGDTKVRNTLQQKIPEVCIFKLPNNEKEKIINFLQNITIPEIEYQRPVIGLINRIQCSLLQ